VGSLAVSPLRTAARLGGGLIRCREEELSSSTCIPCERCSTQARSRLERCRARRCGTLTYLTQASPMCDSSLRATRLSPFWRTRSTCNVWAGFLGVPARQTCYLLFVFAICARRKASIHTLTLFVFAICYLFLLLFCDESIRAFWGGGREHGLVFVLPSFSKRLPLRYMCMHMTGGGKKERSLRATSVDHEFKL
jgi:hypothetical protein